MQLGSRKFFGSWCIHSEWTGGLHVPQSWVLMQSFRLHLFFYYYFWTTRALQDQRWTLVITVMSRERYEASSKREPNFASSWACYHSGPNDTAVEVGRQSESWLPGGVPLQCNLHQSSLVLSFKSLAPAPVHCIWLNYQLADPRFSS